MAHTTKVRPMKSSGSSETMANQTSANNEGKLDNHDPRLTKLLTGICLGQVVIVTVTAVSLGVFVNENVKEIDTLKLITGTLQSDMDRVRLNMTQGAYAGFTATVDIETKLSQFEMNLEALNERVNKTRIDQDVYTTAIKGTSDRLTHVEKTVEEQLLPFVNQSFIDKLVCPDILTDTESRLLHLEANQTSYQLELQQLITAQSEIDANLTSLDNTIKSQNETINTISTAVLQLETSITAQNNSLHERLTLLEINNTEYQSVLLSQSLLLKQLQENNNNIYNISHQSYSSRIATLELDKTYCQDVLLNQTIRLSQLESDFRDEVVVTQAQESRIMKLESDQTTDHDVILNLTIIINQLEAYAIKDNGTLQEHILRIQGLERDQSENQDQHANLTSKLNKLEERSLKRNVTIHAHESRISTLESDLAMNLEVTFNHTIRIVAVETAFASVNATLQNMTTSIAILESEETSNPSGQTADPAVMKDFLGYLIADVIPFQTIANNTKRIQQLEDSTSDQDISLVELSLEVNKTWNAVQEYKEELVNERGAQSAFTVAYPVTGSTSSHLRFTRVITNIGGHYSTSTGIFTSEYPGIYEFALHILKKGGAASAHCAIRKNQSSVATASSDPQGDSETGYFSSSASVVIQLARGDKMDVYCRSTLNNLNTDYTFMFNSFSGFLLQAD